MIIDGQMVAPHFGTWNLTCRTLPEQGVAVVAVLWGDDGTPALSLLEWHIIEEDEEVDEDDVFEVRSDSTGDEFQRAAWFIAFPADDEVDTSVVAPHIWAETRFVIPVPLSVCDDCGGYRPVEGDDCGEECE
jgi:hypothetical protein